ncbi:hypothetical protein KY285_036712 [Solanum tuberosum]|nr:hypothetical protein KY289_036927 [Solanum tuberosum]KAH0640126.1 hypothetical protein KY285_036712 [Solanum tuberosum]
MLPFLVQRRNGRAGGQRAFTTETRTGQQTRVWTEIRAAISSSNELVIERWIAPKETPPTSKNPPQHNK